MKTRYKVLLMFLLILMLFGCQFDCHYLDEEQPVRISSVSSFSIDGIVYTKTTKFLPVRVYNPNKYNIVVICNHVEYPIEPFNTILFDITYNEEQ